jgi:hypothetical protein
MSVFKDKEAVKCLSSLHDKYVIFLADKASNNIVFVCKYHLWETLMLNDIQITSDYMSRWVVLKKRVGAVTSQRVLKVLFCINILQCVFVVENFTANAVSVCDVASFRLFKPVRSEPLHENNRKFLHIPFANKGIDAINISTILNRKAVGHI